MTKPPQEEMLWFNDSDLGSLDDVEEKNKVCKQREVSWISKYMDGTLKSKPPRRSARVRQLITQGETEGTNDAAPVSRRILSPVVCCPPRLRNPPPHQHTKLSSELKRKMEELEKEKVHLQTCLAQSINFIKEINKDATMNRDMSTRVSEKLVELERRYFIEFRAYKEG